MTGSLRQACERIVRRGGAGRRRGAVLIEAAFVILILLMLTFGAIEYGCFFFMQHTLTGAARTGARQAILAGQSNSGIEAVVRTALSDTGVNGDGATVTITDAAGNSIALASAAAGTDVKVTVSVPSFTLGGGIVPGVPGTVRASVVMRKEAT